MPGTSEMRLEIGGKSAQPERGDHAEQVVPVIIIDASATSSLPRFAELMEYRDLLAILTWRDIAVRYKQTVFGVAWALLQPLLMMVLFSFLFGRLARMPSDDLPYPLFALYGLVIWGFFSTAVTNGGNSLVGNASLITKVHFPRAIVPCAAVAAALLDLAIGLVLLVILAIYYRLSLGRLVLLVPVVLVLAVFAFAVAVWTAGLNVKYRDVRHALPFVLQLWLFASPVIYPLSLVPAKWRWVLIVNPLTGILEATRACLGTTVPDVCAVAWAVLSSTMGVLYALSTFRRMEAELADVV
jgi:lipopolysaccharide transport system permease protein